MTNSSRDFKQCDLEATTAPIWRRARACDAGHCVEIAHHDGQVLIRDSKDPDVVIAFDRRDWSAFVDGVWSGDFVGVPGA
jgi:hypothetical protein